MQAARDRSEEGARELQPQSGQDRCAECGGTNLGDGWVSYRRDPTNVTAVLKHFGGMVWIEAQESQSRDAKTARRDFRYPEDLGVFFHRTCAPPGVALEEDAGGNSDHLGPGDAG